MQQAIHSKRNKQIGLISLILVVFTAFGYFGYKNFVETKVKPVSTANGLNSKLPEAEKPRDLNKLELYMQAEKDSLARAEQKANDPYINHLLSQNVEPDSIPKIKRERNSSSRKQVKPREQAATKPDKRIDEIYKLIEEKPIEQEAINKAQVKTETKIVEPVAIDPELKQLETMLDKLAALQNPQQPIQKNTELPKKVDTLYKTFIVNSSQLNQTIRAVIHNTQTVYNGSTVKLRLLTDIYIGAVAIQRGNFIYGICSLNNERVNIQLSKINYHNQAIPVAMTVLDMDGIEGVHIIGNLSREAISEGTDKAINSFSLNSYSTSIASQVAGAGIQAGKSLLSKKVKLQTATLKASHYVLLQNQNAY